jgi:hypothetical protein
LDLRIMTAARVTTAGPVRATTEVLGTAGADPIYVRNERRS